MAEKRPPLAERLIDEARIARTEGNRRLEALLREAARAVDNATEAGADHAE